MGESDEGHEPEASRVPYSEDDVVRVAAQLDSVAEERSRYRRFTAARDAFLSKVDGHDAVKGSTDPQDDDPESEPAPAVGPAGNWDADLDTDEIDDEYEFDDEDDRLASKVPTLEAAAWAAMRRVAATAVRSVSDMRGRVMTTTLPAPGRGIARL